MPENGYGFHTRRNMDSGFSAPNNFDNSISRNIFSLFVVKFISSCSQKEYATQFFKRYTLENARAGLSQFLLTFMTPDLIGIHKRMKCGKRTMSVTASKVASILTVTGDDFIANNIATANNIRQLKTAQEDYRKLYGLQVGDLQQPWPLFDDYPRFIWNHMYG